MQGVRSEANVSNDAAIAVSKAGGKSFRNNVGGAWSGKKIRTLPNGDVVLRDAMWINFGLMKGSADRIGWVPVTITQDMVGQRFARFLSMEMKTETGRASDAQIKWHDIVWRDGGLSGFCRCVEDAERIMRGEKIDP